MSDDKEFEEYWDFYCVDYFVGSLPDAIKKLAHRAFIDGQSILKRENETLREQNFAMNKTIAELNAALHAISEANYASPERLREMAAEQCKG